MRFPKKSNNLEKPNKQQKKQDCRLKGELVESKVCASPNLFVSARFLRLSVPHYQKTRALSGHPVFSLNSWDCTLWEDVLVADKSLDFVVNPLSW